MGSLKSILHWYQCVPGFSGAVGSTMVALEPLKEMSNQPARPCRIAARRKYRNITSQNMHKMMI